MNARPQDGSDGPEAVDDAMLAVLSNRGRMSTVLSADQERLLDDWVAGGLAADGAERAATLVKQNALAAEHVLERRLLAAAEQGPAIPHNLTQRVLGGIALPKAPPARASGWRSLGRWQWPGLVGAAALASIVLVVGLSMLQQTMHGGAPVQVAMVTIGDRDKLFEPSDVRMRGPTPQPPITDQRFRDVEIPTALLKDLVAAAGQPKGAASREIERTLLAPGETADRPARVIVDAALRQRLDAASGDRMAVRLYNLNDPRAADVRNLVGLPPGNERAYLLTVRP